MNRNTARIRDGIKALTGKPYELISGTVVAGSTDPGAGTVSILPTGEDHPVEGVVLRAIAGGSSGVLLVPKDGSDVVIASIDGPGEWMVIKSSELEKAIITIGNVSCELDDTQLSITNGSVTFGIGNAVYKMNTAGESLFQWLTDLVTALTALTVGTSVGPSTVPVNVAAFTALLTRLSSLLSA